MVWMFHRFVDVPSVSFSLGNHELTSDETTLFCATPMAIESFDGEVAYLILNQTGMSKLIWRDYHSKILFECAVDFEDYIKKWETIQEILSTASSLLDVAN